MPASLEVFCRVSAAVGPLRSNPGNKRRTRERYVGTIIRSDPNRHWTVLWDNVGLASTHSWRVLKFETSSVSSTSSRMNGEEILNLLSSKSYVKDQAGLDASLVVPTPTPAPTQPDTGATEDVAPAPVPPHSAPVPPSITANWPSPNTELGRMALRVTESMFTQAPAPTLPAPAPPAPVPPAPVLLALPAPPVIDSIDETAEGDDDANVFEEMFDPRTLVDEFLNENDNQARPAGSHLVLESDEESLLAVGYKYNKRKVICFVASKGAGHTEEGVRYEAKWRDENHNRCCRYVPRPSIVSKYFTKSNVIDAHNQARQGELALEKHWVTRDGFFRILTTILGMCTVDAWKGYKYHLSDKHRHKHIGIVSFAGLLATDCLRNDLPHSSDELAMVLDIGDSPETVGGSSTATMSPVPFEIGSFPHQLQTCQETEIYNNSTQNDAKRSKGERVRRGKCSYCQKNTRFFCQECPLGPKQKRRWICDRGECTIKHKDEVNTRI